MVTRARTEAISSPAQERAPTLEHSQLEHYEVNTAEQQTTSKVPPNMWQYRNTIPLQQPTEVTSHPHPMQFCSKVGVIN